ncbi:hypothetical protein SAMN05192552_103515 [Natrinema hispanicum]|uniref:Uncharacterized protein n=1 Tax=Natrinema hispanicum TaxID=392421 RepID=A0A1I0JIL3_9EURY|nr:hypothetical protein SAMN05192552_103515 [Natrinema hispanicum]SEU09411.1 hypothetical protein SAMN04488694_14216 [Natrinema hispanicum]
MIAMPRDFEVLRTNIFTIDELSQLGAAKQFRVVAITDSGSQCSSTMVVRSALASSQMARVIPWTP